MRCKFWRSCFGVFSFKVSVVAAEADLVIEEDVEVSAIEEDAVVSEIEEVAVEGSEVVTEEDEAVDSVEIVEVQNILR